MSRGKLGMLNEYLFEELDKLTNEDVKGKDLEQEIARSNAVCNVAKTIIENAALVVRATRINAEFGTQESMNNLLEINE